MDLCLQKSPTVNYKFLTINFRYLCLGVAFSFCLTAHALPPEDPTEENRTENERVISYTNDFAEPLPPKKINPVVRIISKAYRAATGLPGNIINFVGTKIHEAHIDKETYDRSSTVQQCAAPLPIGSSRLGEIGDRIVYATLSSLTQMRHTWMKVGDGDDTLTYGMPSTDKMTYFGGAAHIFSPDPFVDQVPQMSMVGNCKPVYKPKTVSNEDFERRFTCIAGRLSASWLTAEDRRSWTAVLDYHATKNNCAMAVKFVVECAGGKMPLLVNLGVGDNYSPTDKVVKHEQVFWPHPVGEVDMYTKFMKRLRFEMYYAYYPESQVVNMDEVPVFKKFKRFLTKNWSQSAKPYLDPNDFELYKQTYLSLASWLDYFAAEVTKPGRFRDANEMDHWVYHLTKEFAEPEFLLRGKKDTSTTLGELCSLAQQECNLH